MVVAKGRNMTVETFQRRDSGRNPEPVVMRFEAAGFQSPELLRQVMALGGRVETLAAKSVIQTQDAPTRRPRYVVSGWAARHRYLSDGRRQIFDLVLPGEGIGVCLRPNPLANTTTTALTPLRLIDASPLMHPDAFAASRELLPALQSQADAEERRALNQIVRLGRLTALERLAHLLLEIEERLAVVGMVGGDGFALPLTQETLADMTGLSIVHVNRTIQELRRQNLVRLERGFVRLLDRASLVQLADYTSAAAQDRSV